MPKTQSDGLRIALGRVEQLVPAAPEESLTDLVVTLLAGRKTLAGALGRAANRLVLCSKAPRNFKRSGPILRRRRSRVGERAIL
jgi:hypothetical protein